MDHSTVEKKLDSNNKHPSDKSLLFLPFYGLDLDLDLVFPYIDRMLSPFSTAFHHKGTTKKRR